MNGVNFSSRNSTTASWLGAVSNLRSLYMRSSMKMRSSEAKKSCSSSSPLRISSSLRSSPIVRSTLLRSTSLTVRNTGLLSSMTQQLGDKLISQSVKA